MLFLFLFLVESPECVHVVFRHYDTTFEVLISRMLVYLQFKEDYAI